MGHDPPKQHVHYGGKKPRDRNAEGHEQESAGRVADDRSNCGKKAGPEQRSEQRDKQCPGELMRCLGGASRRKSVVKSADACPMDQLRAS